METKIHLDTSCIDWLEVQGTQAEMGGRNYTKRRFGYCGRPSIQTLISLSSTHIFRMFKIILPEDRRLHFGTRDLRKSARASVEQEVYCITCVRAQRTIRPSRE